jgi:hypothetical protein
MMQKKKKKRRRKKQEAAIIWSRWQKLDMLRIVPLVGRQMP